MYLCVFYEYALVRWVQSSLCYSIKSHTKSFQWRHVLIAPPRGHALSMMGEEYCKGTHVLVSFSLRSQLSNFKPPKEEKQNLNQIRQPLFQHLSTFVSHYNMSTCPATTRHRRRCRHQMTMEKHHILPIAT